MNDHEQSQAWLAVLRAFERSDAVDVAREVQRQIDRLWLLQCESEQECCLDNENGVIEL
jgi:hypothetical protein